MQAVPGEVRAPGRKRKLLPAEHLHASGTLARPLAEGHLPEERGQTSPPAAASLHLDETSWRQRGDMHWLWIAATDRKRAGEALAVLALAGATTRFELWHRFKAGSLTRAALLSGTAGYRAAFKRFCTRGSRQKRDRKWRSLGADLLRQWDCVFRFLETAGVEPTNKTAEQGPRSAVIWRRTTQGTRTAAEGPCRACSLGPGPSRGYRGGLNRYAARTPR